MRGDSEDISSVIPEIYSIFSEVEKAEHEKNEADLLAKQVCVQIIHSTVKWLSHLLNFLSAKPCNDFS